MRKMLFWTVSVSIVVLTAAPASAGLQAVRVTPDRFTLTTRHPMMVQIHEPGVTYSTVQSVCFLFQFGSDPLDPGDEVFIALGPSPQETIGFSNPTATPQTSRTLCLQSAYDNTGLLTKFADGRVRVSIGMRSGSVVVTALKVQIAGVA